MPWCSCDVTSILRVRVCNRPLPSAGTPLQSLIARFMGPIWGRQDPGGPHVGPMNFAIWGSVIMASQITGVMIVYSTICSGADQRKHQSSASLAFVREIDQSLVNSLHKGTVMWKMIPFDVLMPELCLPQLAADGGMAFRSRAGQNGRHFLDDIIKCIFLNENVWISIKISLEVCSWGSKQQFPNIGSDNGLASARRQAIIWTTDAYMHHLASMSQHGCYLIPPWISHYNHYKMWDE